MEKHQRDAQRLLKLLTYILGRHPDEFGLVPDENGYVKTKDLVKAMVEEDGLGHIRQKNIDTLFITLPDLPLERDGHLIRVRHRDKLPQQAPIKNPPPLLYTCVRRRAYPVVYRNGITGMGVPRVILATHQQMAKRIGQRYDQQAICLTVHTKQCQAKGVVFYGVGDSLFWAAEIPPGCFTGPPLPEEKSTPQKQEPVKRSRPEPGSVILDSVEKIIPSDRKDPRGSRDKIDKKRRKKVKRKRRPPPWRS